MLHVAMAKGSKDEYKSNEPVEIMENLMLFLGSLVFQSSTTRTTNRLFTFMLKISRMVGNIGKQHIT